MRSYLFVPASDLRKMEKAFGSGADVVILDLEDSVAPEMKERARTNAAEFLANTPPDSRKTKVCVRVNSRDSGLLEEDISAVIPGAPEKIMLPKSVGGTDIMAVSSTISVAEARAGLPDMSTRIIAVATETASAVFGLGTYAGSSERLSALTWGAEDLSSDIGSASTRLSGGEFREPFRLVRNLCLFGAVSAAVEPVDTVYTGFRDLAGLKSECEASAADGFTGKLAIHPAQVPVINEAFTPSADAIEKAEAIVAAFSENPDAGTIGLDGEMIDIPHLRRSERLLARAAAMKFA